jgi:peptidoglycan/LPS O-acetylase OafA/YrhL
MLRIYPMLFVGVMAGFGAHWMRGDLIREFWPLLFDPEAMVFYLKNWQAYDGNVPAYLGAALTLTNGIVPNWMLPNAETAFNGVIWSLSLEFQFYLVAPMLCLLLRKRGLLTCAGVFLVMVFRKRIFPPVGGVPWATVHGSFLPFNIEWFVIGIMSYVVYAAVKSGVPGERTGRSGLLDMSVGLLMLTAVGDAWRLTGVNGFEQVFGDRLPLMVWVAVMSYIIDVKQGRSGVLNRGMAWVLESRLSLWLGKLSYSVYLIHGPVIILVQWLVVRHLGVTTWRGCFLATAALTIPVTLVVAAGCYRWVELPFINLGKRKAAVTGK